MNYVSYQLLKTNGNLTVAFCPTRLVSLLATAGRQIGLIPSSPLENGIDWSRISKAMDDTVWK